MKQLDALNENDKRAWAFDMAVKLHGEHALHTEKVMEEADKIYDYVFKREENVDSGPKPKV